eukprot:9186955-Ditylum_brightwellii.AAC.1
MGVCSIDSHPFYIVPSASSYTHPCHKAHSNEFSPSTAPIRYSNLVFQTSETRQNMPSLCQLPIQGKT